MQSSILLGLDARIRVWTFGSEPGTFVVQDAEVHFTHTQSSLGFA